MTRCYAPIPPCQYGKCNNFRTVPRLHISGGHSCSEMIEHLLTWCIYASVNFYLPGTFESGHIPHVLGPKGPVFHSGVNGLAFYLFLLLHFISIFSRPYQHLHTGNGYYIFTAGTKFSMRARMLTTTIDLNMVLQHLTRVRCTTSYQDLEVCILYL